MLRPDHLLHSTPKGLYCPIGDFYLDPVRGAVDRAIISHGHADHARGGHGKVLAHPDTLAIMAIRYGANFAKQQQALPYGQRIEINGVTVWLAPAGHILGSAQIIVEYKGQRITFSGDYKRRPDPTCEAFEPVADSHIFISEATFGLPVFQHPDTAPQIETLLSDIAIHLDRTHCIGAYSLGKAQRVIRHLRIAGYDAPIFIHTSLEKICAHYQSRGIDLGELITEPDAAPTLANPADYLGRVVVAPSSCFSANWGQRFPSQRTAFASGWMGIKKRAISSGIDLPLIISDHADWTELTQTITEMDPYETWITYGKADALIRWAELNGRRARALSDVSKLKDLG